MVRFKERIRELTRRTRDVSLQGMVKELNVYLREWHGYFGFCQTPSVFVDLDSWIRRKLRCVVWKQRKRGRTRYKERASAASMRSWRPKPPVIPMARGGSVIVPAYALPSRMRTSMGSVSFDWQSGRQLNPPNRRARTRTHGDVTGTAGNRLPVSIPGWTGEACWVENDFVIG